MTGPAPFYAGHRFLAEVISNVKAMAGADNRATVPVMHAAERGRISLRLQTGGYPPSRLRLDLRLYLM
jgi:hypothetical protein